MEVQRQSYKTSKKAICSKARMLKARVPKFLTSRGGGHRWGRSARCTWMNLIGLVMSGRGVNVVMMLVLGLLGRLNLFRIAPFSSALQASDSRPLPSAPRLAFPRGASPLPHHQILDDTLARWGSHKKNTQRCISPFFKKKDSTSQQVPTCEVHGKGLMNINI